MGDLACSVCHQPQQPERLERIVTSGDPKGGHTAVYACRGQCAKVARERALQRPHPPRTIEK